MIQVVLRRHRIEKSTLNAASGVKSNSVRIAESRRGEKSTLSLADKCSNDTVCVDKSRRAEKSTVHASAKSRCVAKSRPSVTFSNQDEHGHVQYTQSAVISAPPGHLMSVTRHRHPGASRRPTGSALRQPDGRLDLRAGAARRLVLIYAWCGESQGQSVGE
jgi:hypothetical protein